MKFKLLIIAFCCFFLGVGFVKAHTFLMDSEYYKQSFFIALNQNEATVETFLKNSTVRDTNKLDENQILKKEIDRLNKDLDNLQTNFNNLKKENEDLKVGLKEYKSKDNIKFQRSSLIDNLSKEARESKAYYDSIKAPDLYVSALNLLIIGNVDTSSAQLNEFISKSLEEINTSKNVELSKTQNFFLSYSNYWLGKIENINGEYSKAVENFSESYKITTNSKISLISLVGLIESLSKLYKDAEACIAIKQFNNEYAETLKNSKTQLDSSYLEVVSKFSSINKC